MKVKIQKRPTVLFEVREGRYKVREWFLLPDTSKNKALIKRLVREYMTCNPNKSKDFWYKISENGCRLEDGIFENGKWHISY